MMSLERAGWEGPSAASILYELRVEGTPVPQGNHRIGNGGRLYDAAGDRLAVWRNIVALEARHVSRGKSPLDEPVAVYATFRLDPPKRPTFGSWPAVHPDLDKLQRSVGDALVMGNLLADDGRIVRWVAEKVFGVPAGVDIAVARMSPRTEVG